MQSGENKNKEYRALKNTASAVTCAEKMQNGHDYDNDADAVDPNENRKKKKKEKEKKRMIV